MIITEWVVMMVMTSVVPMGLWLVWWRSATLGMWTDIAGGNQVDKMVVKMMVVVTDLWMEWMLEIDRGGGGGSSEVEGVGNLGRIFIMDMDIFE